MPEQNEREGRRANPMPLSMLTDNTNPIVWVLQVFAMPSEIYLRRGFGCRYFGGRALGALLAVAIFLYVYADDDPMPLTRFFIGFFILLVIARLMSLYRTWRGGKTEHSRYDGKPWIKGLLPQWREASVKRLEAITVFLTGASIKLYWNSPLGQFLMFSGASMLGLMAVYYFIRRSRAVDMNDSMLEQRMMSDHFQDLQNR